MSFLSQNDPALHELLGKELSRQQNSLSLIPSENYVSEAVLEALGSVATNKYSEGYPGKRYYGGNAVIDEIENMAISRAKDLFGVDHVNVQPYSGSPANQAVYFALLKPGDTVMGLSLPEGGHLTHGWKVSFSGKQYKSESYGLDVNGYLDYDEIEKLAQEHKPKLLICGATAYPREIDFARFRAIADSVGAYLLADISHIAGLVAGGVHASPAAYADVITTTTHKTLRGPRGAMIMCRKDLASAIDKAVFPGLQGGPHNHTTAAIAVALSEACQPAFRDYAEQVVKNARALGERLVTHDFDLVTGGTDNHLLLADLTRKGVTGQQAENALDSIGITLNKNMVPGDPRSPFDPSGIRFGSPAITTRGMKEGEVEIIADIMAAVIGNPEDEAVLTKAREFVAKLCASFPLYPSLSY